MIAVDTSSLIAYLSDQTGSDVDLVELSLQQKNAVFPPVVVTELLSDPKLPESVVQLFLTSPKLEPGQGFWLRAGKLRTSVLAKRRKARLADCLIAQTCLDHDVALVTRDRDFRNFALVSELKVLGV